MSYTTTDLLATIRNRGSIPASTNDNNINSNANLLIVATEQLHTKLYPQIQATREEFYVNDKDYSITANQAEYEIPTRASGLILRDIQIIEGNTINSLSPVDPELITTTATGGLEGYYLRHNKVVLYPTPASTSGTLRLRYYLRPSRLTLTTNCALISSIDTGLNQVVVSTIPSSWAAATEIDFVKKTAPFANLALDQSISGVTGTTITFSSLPTGLTVGDWIAPAGFTPIPQLPFEFLPILAQLTVVKVMEALGDREAAKLAYTDLQSDIDNAFKLISPRNHGERRKCINRNFTRR